MQLELTNKTAFVSGSTKGIGFAIARQLAAEGARVILNGRSDKALADATAQLRRTTPDAQVEGLVGDLSDAKTSDVLAQQFPAVDVLVNNLGIFEPKPFEATPDEDWR